MPQLIGVILLLVAVISAPLSISVIRHGNFLLGLAMFLLFVLFCLFASGVSLFANKPRYVLSPAGIYHLPVFKPQNIVLIEWQNIRHVQLNKIKQSQFLSFGLRRPVMAASMLRTLDKKLGYGDFSMTISGLNYKAKILLPLINTLLVTQPEQRRFVIQAFLDRH